MGVQVGEQTSNWLAGRLTAGGLAGDRMGGGGQAGRLVGRKMNWRRDR